MHLSKRTLCVIAAGLSICGATSGCRLIDRFTKEPVGSDVKATTTPAKPLLFMASVDGGVIRTRASGKTAWEQEVRDQLAYASGQLREIGGLMDPDRVEVELDATKIKDDGDVNLVPFKAKFPVSWNGETATPPSLTLFLPKGGDKDSRQAFFTAFREHCADPAATDMALRTFWYHYRPSRPTCEIGRGTFDHSLVARPTLLLTAQSK